MKFRGDLGEENREEEWKGLETERERKEGKEMEMGEGVCIIGFRGDGRQQYTSYKQQSVYSYGTPYEVRTACRTNVSSFVGTTNKRRYIRLWNIMIKYAVDKCSFLQHFCGRRKRTRSSLQPIGPT